MASKAQMQMLLRMGPKNSDSGDSTDTKDFGRTNKKKKGNLSGAARRKLASMQAAQKKQGQKNGNN